jgi:hypothetical protein
MSGFQPPTTKPGIEYPRTMKTVQFTPLGDFRGWFSPTWHNGSTCRNPRHHLSPLSLSISLL